MAPDAPQKPVGCCFLTLSSSLRYLFSSLSSLSSLSSHTSSRLSNYVVAPQDLQGCRDPGRQGQVRHRRAPASRAQGGRRCVASCSPPPSLAAGACFQQAKATPCRRTRQRQPARGALLARVLTVSPSLRSSHQDARERRLPQRHGRRRRLVRRAASPRARSRGGRRCRRCRSSREALARRRPRRCWVARRTLRCLQVVPARLVQHVHVAAHHGPRRRRRARRVRAAAHRVAPEHPQGHGPR